MSNFEIVKTCVDIASIDVPDVLGDVNVLF